MSNLDPQRSEVFMKRAVVIGSLAMLMAACGGGSIGAAEGSSDASGEDTVLGLLLDENSDAVTRGRFVATDGRISFFATSSGDDRVVRVEINGKTFDVTADTSVTVDGHGAVLTVAEKAALLTFAETVTSRFQTEAKGATRFEGLANLGAYLSEAPAGYIHRRLVNGQVLPEGVAAAPANNTRVCLTSGRTYSVDYTALKTAKLSTTCGNAGLRSTYVCQNQAAYVTSSTTTTCTVVKPVVAGSDWGGSVCNSGNYGCMGRCGAGCSTLFGTKLTLDCLRHDTCSHDKVAAGQGSDTSCGDEYSNASDDANAACNSTL
jgi:hypothetical protein